MLKSFISLSQQFLDADKDFPKQEQKIPEAWKDIKFKYIVVWGLFIVPKIQFGNTLPRSSASLIQSCDL